MIIGAAVAGFVVGGGIAAFTGLLDRPPLFAAYDQRSAHLDHPTWILAAGSAGGGASGGDGLPAR